MKQKRGKKEKVCGTLKINPPESDTGMGVCHEGQFKIEYVNYTEDGGRPPGVGSQEQASNHLKLPG